MIKAMIILSKEEKELICPKTPIGNPSASLISTKSRLKAIIGGPPVAIEVPRAKKIRVFFQSFSAIMSHSFVGCDRVLCSGRET